MEFDPTKINISSIDHVTILQYIDEPNDIRLTVCIIQNINNITYYINITKINPHLANQFRTWKKRIAGRDYMTNLSRDTGIQQSKLTETIRNCQKNRNIYGLYIHYNLVINVVIDWITDVIVQSILRGLVNWYITNHHYSPNTPNNTTTISELDIIKILDKYEEVYRVSKEKECGICYEVVYSKRLENDRYFGLLDSCNHIFCITCINIWHRTRRETGASDNCPICRTRFRNITMSKFYKLVN
ncbi:CPXV023 protein [Cowpox virus]|uniref:Host range factor p28 n=1 Tax=Cowpox virus TaxID=10243 RepID=U5TH14_COWPX|nr:CPXV023 protein [Cowpox virus]